jgi:arsenate reductase-like glutaredoxin family protein
LTPSPAVPLSELELLPELKSKNKIVVFHNGMGSMCLEFLDFMESIDHEFEEHLTSEDNFYSELNLYKNDFQKSQGISEDFGYYPIIFIKGEVYSGFNEEIQDKLEKLI